MKTFEWDEKYPETKKIMEEMCRRVGAKLEDIDPTEEDWYLKYSWTEEEYENFIKWVVDYLYNSCAARKEFLTIDNCIRVPKKRITRAIRWFLFC